MVEGGIEFFSVVFVLVNFQLLIGYLTLGIVHMIFLWEGFGKAYTIINASVISTQLFL